MGSIPVRGPLKTVSAPSNLVPKNAPAQVGRVVTTLAKPPLSAATILKKAASASASQFPQARGVRSKIELFDAADLTQGYFRCILYGETSRRKSTTAALFSDPEHTRIVLLRRKEQLLPLRDQGYKQIAYCDTLEKAQEALAHPEDLWPDWAKLEERVLILDDLTQLKDDILEDSEFKTDDNGNVKEIRDARLIHKIAKDTMKGVIRRVLDKPMHFICVALAVSFPSPIDGNERIWPDLPPKMGNMLDTDFEFVLYIDDDHKLVTREDSIPFRYMDPKTNKESVKMRRIFAKSKLPLQYCGTEPGTKPLLNLREPLDLRALWEKIQTAQ